MLGLITNLTKAAVGVVTLPLPIVADVFTMAGAMTERKNPYTYDQCADIMDNLKDAVDPDKD
jgi:hypothetical protein